MYQQSGPQAYAQVSLESRLTGATPHQLIAMLFEGAHNAVLRAKIYFENGNVAKRGEMISKAINIIDNGLRAALDHKKGMEIAADLEQLYDYISRLLIQANLHSDVEKLMLADKFIMDISSAWDAIAPHARAGQR
ncbi:flagellar protein FliS [Enterobacter sp. BIGb0383]|uniref:flagellar export chaperone FliS n=1 Tax=unclassified Enterobacter TaxID=2608935 RepID=UPI000F4933D2|nr:MULTISPECIES: flagellar export chaperone FliS [unclassified Enterobacter]ROP58318.1 flagellar protein FliS [Enterobacter sp. BIGb0383]ROS06794.1 flagellar protein FliS [Enterobacter sp. BIGb0359]